MPHLTPPRRCERSQRLLAHEPLVQRIARRIGRRVPASVELDDLVQAGRIGLNEALSRYEDERGASFDSYAARRIEGAMLDVLRAADHLSRDTRARLRAVRTAVERLQHRLGRVPRAKEVANELGWTLQEFHDRMVDAGASGARPGDVELEHHEEEAAWEAYAERTEDSGALSVTDDDPLRNVQRAQRHAALNAAFDALEERDRLILRSLYVDDASQAEVGAQLGVSASRVCQLHEEIVSKLRRRLRDW